MRKSSHHQKNNIRKDFPTEASETFPFKVHWLYIQGKS